MSSVFHSRCCEDRTSLLLFLFEYFDISPPKGISLDEIDVPLLLPFLKADDRRVDWDLVCKSPQRLLDTPVNAELLNPMSAFCRERTAKAIFSASASKSARFSGDSDVLECLCSLIAPSEDSLAQIKAEVSIEKPRMPLNKSPLGNFERCKHSSEPDIIIPNKPIIKKSKKKTFSFSFRRSRKVSGVFDVSESAPPVFSANTPPIERNSDSPRSSSTARCNSPHMDANPGHAKRQYENLVPPNNFAFYRCAIQWGFLDAIDSLGDSADKMLTFIRSLAPVWNIPLRIESLLLIETLFDAYKRDIALNRGHLLRVLDVLQGLPVESNCEMQQRILRAVVDQLRMQLCSYHRNSDGLVTFFQCTVDAFCTAFEKLNSSQSSNATHGGLAAEIEDIMYRSAHEEYFHRKQACSQGLDSITTVAALYQFVNETALPMIEKHTSKFGPILCLRSGAKPNDVCVAFVRCLILDLCTVLHLDSTLTTISDDLLDIFSVIRALLSRVPNAKTSCFANELHILSGLLSPLVSQWFAEVQSELQGSFELVLQKENWNREASNSTNRLPTSIADLFFVVNRLAPRVASIFFPGIDEYLAGFAQTVSGLMHQLCLRLNNGLPSSFGDECLVGLCSENVEECERTPEAVPSTRDTTVSITPATPPATSLARFTSAARAFARKASTSPPPRTNEICSTSPPVVQRKGSSASSGPTPSALNPSSKCLILRLNGLCQALSEYEAAIASIRKLRNELPACLKVTQGASRRSNDHSIEDDVQSSGRIRATLTFESADDTVEATLQTLNLSIETHLTALAERIMRTDPFETALFRDLYSIDIEYYREHKPSSQPHSSRTALQATGSFCVESILRPSSTTTTMAGVLDHLDQSLTTLLPLTLDANLSAKVVGSVAKAFLQHLASVLIEGGENRIFHPGQCSDLNKDLDAVKHFFCHNRHVKSASPTETSMSPVVMGDELDVIVQIIGKSFVDIERILDLMALSSEELVHGGVHGPKFEDLPSQVPAAPRLPLCTSVVGSILRHRKDPVAKAFVKHHTLMARVAKCPVPLLQRAIVSAHQAIAQSKKTT